MEPPIGQPPGRGRQRRPTHENMLDIEGLLSGCDEFGTRIRIFTATLTGEREYKAHLGKFRYTGSTIPPDGELPSDVTQTEEVTQAPGVRGRLETGRLRHGYGEIEYESGSVFRGQWAFGKREGLGKFIYPCGDVYEGEWKAGKYHGRGKYTSGDSGGRALEYEGEWKADKMEGYGRYIYKDTSDLVRQPGERTPPPRLPHRRNSLATRRDPLISVHISVHISEEPVCQLRRTLACAPLAV